MECKECNNTFKDEVILENHKHSGHCAACGDYIGDLSRRTSMASKNLNFHKREHFTVDKPFIHPVTENKKIGGYLCKSCTTDDLNYRK